MHIAALRNISLLELLKASFNQFRSHDMKAYAAAIAYHLLFSLFSFIVFLIALLGFLDLSNLFDWLRQQAQTVFPEQIMVHINEILDQLQTRRVGMLSFGAIVALWAASSAMRSMMTALNRVYGLNEERPAWKRYGQSFLYTLAVGFLLIFAATLVLITPQTIGALADQFGLARMLSSLWGWWLRWPVVIVLLTAIVAIVYRIAPDAEQRFRYVTPGAFVAVIAWAGISLAFEWYVIQIAPQNKFSGSVGTIVAMLFYFYISSLVLLFGAEMNAVLGHGAPRDKDAGRKKIGID